MKVESNMTLYIVLWNKSLWAKKREKLRKGKKYITQKLRRNTRNLLKGEKEINEMVSKGKFNQLTERHSLESQPVLLIKLHV